MRAADRGQQLGDAELVEQQRLDVNHVGDRDDREGRAVGLAGGRIDAGRAGRTVAAAEHVRADHEVAVGVERLAGADQHVPPAEALVVGLVTAGGMGVAREGVRDEHGVVAPLVQRAVGLIGDRDRAERLAALERQRVGRLGDRDEACLDEAGGTGLGVGDDRHIADLRGAARGRAHAVAGLLHGERDSTRSGRAGAKRRPPVRPRVRLLLRAGPGPDRCRR